LSIVTPAYTCCDGSYRISGEQLAIARIGEPIRAELEEYQACDEGCQGCD